MLHWILLISMFHTKSKIYDYHTYISKWTHPNVKFVIQNFRTNISKVKASLSRISVVKISWWANNGLLWQPERGVAGPVASGTILIEATPHHRCIFWIVFPWKCVDVYPPLTPFLRQWKIILQDRTNFWSRQRLLMITTTVTAVKQSNFFIFRNTKAC